MSVDEDPNAVAMAAVSALGSAVAARAAEAAALDPVGATAARRLADDMAFLQSLPSYAARHEELSTAYGKALDAVWPPTSPDRPSTPAEAAERCRALGVAFQAPGAAAALALSAMPPGDASARVAADGRQASLLGSRLAEAGIDPSEPDATPVGRAALALCDLSASHGTMPVEGLAAEARAAGDLAAALSGAEVTLAALVRLSGRPALVGSDAARLAAALCALPFTWCPALDPATDTSSLAAALVREDDAIASAEAEAVRIDALHGAGWRSEAPAKTGAASRILSTPDDPRRERARPYATSLGATGDDMAMGRTLGDMSRVGNATGRLSARTALAEATRVLPPGTKPDGCGTALAAAEAWKAAHAATEASARFARALAAEPDEARLACLMGASGLVESLRLVPQARLAEPVARLVGRIGAEARTLASHAETLSAYGEDVLRPAMRSARHIRDLAGAMSRIAADPSFAALGLTPSDAIAATDWADAHAELMPPGFVTLCGRDPALPSKLDAAAVAAEGLDAFARDAEQRTGTSAPTEILAAARVALTEIRLRECRDAVEAAGAWGYVARLEDDGVPPSGWEDAMASWPGDEAAVHGSSEVEDVEPVVADPNLWWRRIEVRSGSPEPRPV